MLLISSRVSTSTNHQPREGDLLMILCNLRQANGKLAALA